MQIEPLETRRMLSISLVGRTLRITGTAGDDYIWFGMGGGTSTSHSSSYISNVTVNDETGEFNPHDVKRIYITTDDGNDDIRVPDQFVTGAWHPLDRPGEYREFSVTIPCFIDGGLGNDLIWSGNGRDTLRGGAGNDTIDGGGGDDLLLGDAGKDNLIGGRGADRLIGGKGTDTADYSARQNAVTIFLNGNPIGDGVSGEADEHDQVYGDVENAIGGRGDDSIFGNFFDNHLVGGAGNDTIDGFEHDDTLIGGAGDDQFETFDLFNPSMAPRDDGSLPTVITMGLTYGRDSVIGGSGHDRATTDLNDQPQGVELVTVDRV